MTARSPARPGAARVRREARLAWLLVAPGLAMIVVLALVPLAYTFWESLHVHDLRMPWRGYPFVGTANYVEAAGDPRFIGSMLHTLFFTATSVTLEIVLGTVLALALHRGFRGRGLARTAALLPWAVPTVVAAMIWRFLFEGGAGATGGSGGWLVSLGIASAPVDWLGSAHAAWVPIILADAWKTTPFVALLLLAGLQTIDAELYAAAAIDGAGAWRRFRHVTLPLLLPSLTVALVFRTLDAFRVFDLVYVLTGGGPGTSTEPVALYAFTSLLQHLRFGYGSAISLILFVTTFALALVYIRILGRDVVGADR
jgi:ABC-type sugar transport system permease subunit